MEHHLPRREACHSRHSPNSGGKGRGCNLAPGPETVAKWTPKTFFGTSVPVYGPSWGPVSSRCCKCKIVLILFTRYLAQRRSRCLRFASDDSLPLLFGTAHRASFTQESCTPSFRQWKWTIFIDTFHWSAILSLASVQPSVKRNCSKTPPLLRCSGARCDQGEHYPPVSLIKSLNAHRQAEHCGVSQKQGQHDWPLVLRRLPVTRPSCDEEPTQKT